MCVSLCRGVGVNGIIMCMSSAHAQINTITYARAHKSPRIVQPTDENHTRTSIKRRAIVLRSHGKSHG